MQVHELTRDSGAPLRRYVAHTAEIDPTLLRGCRDLLDFVFDGGLSEADWEHAVGGMHSIITDDDVVIGHVAVVQRRLLHHSIAWRTGYVEAVGVHPRWQRRGVGKLLMAPLQDVITRSYDLGALSASEAARRLYDGLGWQRWLGPTSAVTPDGIVATPDEDDGCTSTCVPQPCSNASTERPLSVATGATATSGDVW